ncbi:MAG TPA: hypothetical protein VF544_01605 [Pyrinomonadaceae bacterium]|jgi:hypothetical protein
MTPQGFQLRTQQFLLQKSGQALAECEDAIAVNAARLRYAVADGATEAFDAGSWAKRLARGWVEAKTPALDAEDFGAWVEAEGKSLHDSWAGLRLAWYAEEKARSGSYAAFVGVEFSPAGERPRWQAIALGDSCLLHCRDGEVLASLPLSDYRRFNAAPVLVPSLTGLQRAALSQAVASHGEARDGDLFLLMSDAAAAWYLMMTEVRDPRRAEFDSSLAGSKQEELAQLFERERRSHRIKDDDVAILRIEIAYK